MHWNQEIVNLETRTIDIFCRVIDNFGDIGVCWRLAQSLSKHETIRLWVDDLTSFHKIEPALDPSLSQQVLKGIDIRHWHDDITDWDAADLVIEAFACDLPDRYLEAMKGKTQCWLNLDYLSAETWVEDFHLQPSRQPNGVPKYFFFPGFNQKTGGLLRLQQRLHNTEAQRHFLKKLLPAEAYNYYLTNKPQLINLFCYPHAPIEALLKALPEDPAVMIILAKSVAPQLEQLATELHSKAYIQRLDFIVQTDFDQLLQVADINLIRGEDSFVQAHWAAKPMLWHIYPQATAQHLVKLDAWLETIGAPAWLQQLHRLWNRSAEQRLSTEQTQEFIQLFKQAAFDREGLKAWHDFQKKLSLQLESIPTLSQQMMNFYEECTKKS